MKENPNKNRLRRSMLFASSQKPSLIRDPYIYQPDSIILDLEDAVADSEKDAARFSLYHALLEVDYRGVERIVRINGIESPYWKEDIRVCVAGGADVIRIPKCASRDDVKIVEEVTLYAEREFGRKEGSTLLMAAIESCLGVINAYEICKSSSRLIGIALSGADLTRDLQTNISFTGVELNGARQQLIIAARAAGVQCFDSVYTNLNDMDGFRSETEMIYSMGFDGKSLISPRQIPVLHDIFTPDLKDVYFAEKVVAEIDSKKDQGIGVFVVDGKMIDIAFYDGARRTLMLAKASGIYKGDLV